MIKYILNYKVKNTKLLSVSYNYSIQIQGCNLKFNNSGMHKRVTITQLSIVWMILISNNQHDFEYYVTSDVNPAEKICVQSSYID